MEKLIQMIDIRKEYKMGDETVYANDGITLDIDKGEFVAIVGKSGSYEYYRSIGCSDFRNLPSGRKGCR